MAIENVRGLRHFANYFSQYQEQFVIIGGVATNFFLQEADFEGRVTKDIDIVVLANPNKSFADKIREYVTLGRYRIESKEIRKHRNDIIRLTYALTEKKFSLPDSLRGDLRAFLAHSQIQTLGLSTLQSLVPNADSLEEFTGLLITHFDLR